jgi:hypothetical protein
MSFFLSLLKYRSLTVVGRILGIKTVKSLQTSHNIVKNLIDVFQSIGKKSRSKDHNETRRVLSQSIVRKFTKKHHLLQQTSHIMKCNVKTLRNYSHRRDILDIGGPTNLWGFIGRLPSSDTKLIGVVKGLVQDF